MYNATSSTTTQTSPSFVVKHNGQIERMTFQDIFVAGHRLWLEQDYPQARAVFSHIAGVTDRGPKAHILWAHCCAMMEDYSECNRVLNEGLPADRYGTAAIDLHDTFVMWKCGMWQDVKQGLEKIVAEHHALPTPCLILGEFLMAIGNTIRPPELLEQAKDRDLPDGAVAMIARQKLVEAKRRANSNIAKSKAPLARRSTLRVPSTARNSTAHNTSQDQQGEADVDS